jgi:hypothetical protein
MVPYETSKTDLTERKSNITYIEYFINNKFGYSRSRSF